MCFLEILACLGAGGQDELEDQEIRTVSMYSPLAGLGGIVTDIIPDIPRV